MPLSLALSFRYCAMAFAILASVVFDHAAAETVEVAPGVKVTKTTFSAPANQQPFYGFVEITPRQRAANAEFVATVERATGSRKKAFEETTKRAWSAFYAGNLAEAATCFNQAYLIDPTQSQVFHGLGLIAFEHFRDPVFAEELLGIARTRPNPSKLLNADYGRFSSLPSDRATPSRCLNKRLSMRRAMRRHGRTSPGLAIRTAGAQQRVRP